MKNLFISVLLLLGVWLLLNASLSPVVIVSGLIVSLIIAVLFSLRHPVFKEMKLNPRALAYFIIYFFVFAIELVKANFDVARRVLSPSLPINPGIVEVKTRLKSKIGRLFLANSITLTPGTLTVDIKGDSLFIHWIDVTSTDTLGATKKIVENFEKYLEVIYG
ncbi:MAG: Na+/H+ antiporter subunit E [Spirochaetia bacterium]|jgi:multicomponent Na+:H+ antiporter subunit E|nr:Na+/H+ antiporter subunit E [Spirochaetia bacterium]